MVDELRTVVRVEHEKRKREHALQGGDGLDDSLRRVVADRRVLGPPGDQVGHRQSQTGVRTEVSGQCQPRICEVVETGFHRQSHRGDQPCGQHEVGVVEGRSKKEADKDW